jgi:outer membrane immunogenic protein
MKTLVILIVLLFSTSKVYSQSPLPVGSSQFNAGLGFSGWGIPVYGGMDFSVHEDITVGFELSFRSYSSRWQNNRYRHSIMGASGNANYHFNSLLNIPQEWGFYAGLNVGFYVWSSPSRYEGSHASGLGIGGQVGGRYYFTDRTGINLEFGGGNAFSSGKIGISYKL